MLVGLLEIALSRRLVWHFGVDDIILHTGLWLVFIILIENLGGFLGRAESDSLEDFICLIPVRISADVFNLMPHVVFGLCASRTVHEVNSLDELLRGPRFPLIRLLLKRVLLGLNKALGEVVVLVFGVAINGRVFFYVKTS